MQLGVVGFIINTVIMKGNQHSFVNGFFQRYFIGHMIIAECVNVFAIHSLRRGCQPQQKLWLKIIDYSLILVIDRMMKFINDHIVKIIRRKVCFCQIFLSAQCGHRRKDHCPIRLFLFAIKETVVIGLPHISKRYRRLF